MPLYAILTTTGGRLPPLVYYLILYVFLSLPASSLVLVIDRKPPAVRMELYLLICDR